MSVIERQAELGRSIYEINTNTLKELATLQRENIEKYFSANRTYGAKLPEVSDLSSFVSLQREYTETSWSNVREAVEAQNGIVRGAFEATREALTKAFTTEQAEEVVTEKPEAVAKPKAKAKAETEA